MKLIVKLLLNKNPKFNFKMTKGFVNLEIKNKNMNLEKKLKKANKEIRKL